MRIKWILILAFLIGSIASGYFLFHRFLQDRQSLRAYHGPTVNRSFEQRTSTPNGTTTKTYTAKELEELRKKGQLPKGMENSNPSQAAAANEAAVQRTLRTLEEINRINEMNRRLLEQQQRNNR